MLLIFGKKINRPAIAWTRVGLSAAFIGYWIFSENISGFFLLREGLNINTGLFATTEPLAAGIIALLILMGPAFNKSVLKDDWPIYTILPLLLGSLDPTFLFLFLALIESLKRNSRGILVALGFILSVLPVAPAVFDYAQSYVKEIFWLCLLMTWLFLLINTLSRKRQAFMPYILSCSLLTFVSGDLMERLGCGDMAYILVVCVVFAVTALYVSWGKLIFISGLMASLVSLFCVYRPEASIFWAVFGALAVLLSDAENYDGEIKREKLTVIEYLTPQIGALCFIFVMSRFFAEFGTVVFWVGMILFIVLGGKLRDFTVFLTERSSRLILGSSIIITCGALALSWLSL